MNEELEENATSTVPLPEGEVLAQVTKLAFVGGEKDGNRWDKMNASVEISDPHYLEDYPSNGGRVVRTLGIMLEMNGKQIATGANKNVRLGKFREACGVNGKPLSALIGRMVKVKVVQKPHPTEPGQTIDDIAGYSAA
jgi:hypothetical protein